MDSNEEMNYAIRKGAASKHDLFVLIDAVHKLRLRSLASSVLRVSSLQLKESYHYSVL